MESLNIRHIKEAAKRIDPYIHRTPVLVNHTINRVCNAEVFFKCENFQKAGAFKIRGAANAVFSLEESLSNNGVATHSSGNHAAALALAAGWRGIKAYVVMPENAPYVKKSAVAEYGAEIVYCTPTLEARSKGLSEIIKRTGANAVHPYNDYRVISGQGTVALELCDEIDGLDAVIIPVGGGGLLSGAAVAVASLSPETSVIAAEPELADDAYRSLEAGHIIPVGTTETIADGLRTSLGDLTFPIIRKHVKEILRVTEGEILNAMRFVWERMKIIIEPSSAVPLGALFTYPAKFKGMRIGIILSGGNVDLSVLPWNKKR